MRLSSLWLGTLALAGCDLSTGPGPIDDLILPPASRVVGVATASQTTCALTADSKLHCWGENRFGEFGNGSTTGSAQPVAGGGGLAFGLIAGSMGTPQMCGVTTGGTSYCWGYNLNGELGDGTTVDRYEPAPIDANIRFRMLTSSYHTCGLSDEDIAYCWGDGLGGQLGTGTDTSALSPARVAGTTTYSHITNGMQFSCALALSGLAECWGWGVGLGSGSADRSVPFPTAVSGGHLFRDISAGAEHVCAVTLAGEVYCWGKMNPFRAEPTRIPMPVPLVSVASASAVFTPGASCGLTAQGVAYCWHSGLEPVPVPGRYQFAELTGGNGRFCGFTPGGSLLCWRWVGAQAGSSTQWVMSPPERAPSLPGTP
jgi:hypothetical protein